MNMYYKRIRELREDHDELQKDIARLLNTTQQVTCKLTAGASPRPTRLELILRENLRADEGICPYKFAKNYSCLVGDGAHTVPQNHT